VNYVAVMNGLFLGLIFYRLSQINARQQGPWQPPQKYRPYTILEMVAVVLIIVVPLVVISLLHPH
jgi:hypothetical protein